MGTENQSVESTPVESTLVESSASGLRSFFTTLLTSVVSVFSSSSETGTVETGTTETGAEESAQQILEQSAQKAATIVTATVQEKVQDTVSSVVGDSVLGSVASGLAGAMAGAVVSEYTDIAVEKVSDAVGDTVSHIASDAVLSAVVGTAVGVLADELSGGVADSKTTEEVFGEVYDATGLGTLNPFDDTSEIYSYTRQVLRHFEGNTATPCIPPVDNSSATISTGLDLGQHDVASLQSMGIPENIIAILEPLLLQDAESARQILENQTVYLNDEQNAIVEQAIIVHYMGTTEVAYDKVLESQECSSTDQDETWTAEMPFVATRFSMLPKEMQAVMVSVLFQHGSPQAVPRFWSFATQGQWQNVVTELRNFYSKATVLSTRREEEADMILLGMGRILQAM